MFQWIFAAFACFRVDRFDNLAGFCFFRSLFLLLLALHIPGVAVAKGKPPVWTVPTQQTSDDGYALLAWEASGDEPNGFFKITETFKGKATVNYSEATELRAWRVAPGEYEFVLQQCVKNDSGTPDCGGRSEKLTLLVSENLTAALLTGKPLETVEMSSGNNPVGGPDQLRPGHWYNPAKTGHGWSFYWSNRLALTPADPLFGNSYDLVGIWYTYEAKYASANPSCTFCPPVTSAYRPVVLKLKAVLLGANSYAGSLYVSRGDGSEVWVGSAHVSFGADNSSAVIDWNANFKKESLSDTDPLELLLGSDPSDATNITHFSGLWQHSGDDRYMVVTNIGDIAEVVTVVFQDDADDPTWIQSVDYGTAVSGSSDFCLAYLYEGYSPQSGPPDGLVPALVHVGLRS